jgi:hypothetical protein
MRGAARTRRSLGCAQQARAQAQAARGRVYRNRIQTRTPRSDTKEHQGAAQQVCVAHRHRQPSARTGHMRAILPRAQPITGKAAQFQRQ